MSTTVIASRTFERKVADGYLVATAKLVHYAGNKTPHFSVTGELWDSQGWYRNGADGRLRECGQLTERILRAFPKLAPVVAVHLADDHGVPMYAVENGWYWYEQSHETAANYLRVSPAELPTDLDREAFERFVATLHDRWENDARTALAIIDPANHVAL